MNLECDVRLAAAYKSRSQIARVLSEAWCGDELYCAACDSNRIVRARTNTPAFDFSCPSCEQRYQLKSLRHWNPLKVVDAGYEAMIQAIRQDRAPHLVLLQYTSEWCIQNVLLIPRTFFRESIIEKRRPLGPSARRAGWIGCNILLNEVPSDGKIPIVYAGVPATKRHVRSEFNRIQGLAKLPPNLRGWTVDVLNVVRRLRKAEFSLRDVYEAEAELRFAHPDNRNIRPKIRQQLQVLRDLGIVEFKGGSNYRVSAQSIVP